MIKKIVNSPWAVLMLLLVSLGLSMTLGNPAAGFWWMAFGGAVIWVLAVINNLGHYYVSLFLTFVGGSIGGVLTTLAVVFVCAKFGCLGLVLVLLSLSTAFLAAFQLDQRGLLSWIR